MKARTQICLAFAVLISCVSVVAASDESTAITTGIISGHVYDADTKQPLSQAFVYCQDVKCSKPVTTNATGYFATDPCFSPSKTYTFQCTRHGYKTTARSVMTDQDGKVVADFNLLNETRIDANETLLANISSVVPIEDYFPPAQTEENGSAYWWSNEGQRFVGQKDYNKALQCFEKATQLEPEIPASWYGKGNVLYSLGRYEEALLAYDEATNRSPLLSGAWYYKSQALRVLHRKGEADTALAKARELGYSS